MPREVNEHSRRTFGCATLFVAAWGATTACDTELRLGSLDENSRGLGGTGAGGEDATGGAGAQGGSPSGCQLTTSQPLIISDAGTTVENVRINALGTPALTILADEVTVRNVLVEHEGAPGIVIEGAANVTLQDVDVVHMGAPATGANESIELNNITGIDCPGLTVTRARLARGSSGVYMERCESATLSEIEGHDIRGPFPRGQLVRFQNSSGGSLTDFSVINPETAWTENNVHVSSSADVYVARGLIDGNNSHEAHGVLFSGDESYGIVEDVDAVRMGNGCFSAYTGGDGTVFRRTRCRENICEDQGRGPPESGGIMWSGDESHTNLSVEDSTYFDACGGLVWPTAAFSTLDLQEEDFSLRAPIELTFCWE